jgi:hypothetical protein
MSNDGDNDVPVAVEHTPTEVEQNLVPLDEVPVYQFVLSSRVVRVEEKPPLCCNS